jgi:hypothetical protein
MKTAFMEQLRQDQIQAKLATNHFRSVLSSHLLSKNLNIKIQNATILPVVCLSVKPDVLQ